MRQVISVSLPQETTREIKSLSKMRGFSSVSGYIKHLIELDKDLISEKDLLGSVKQARKDYKEGRTVVAKSISELI
jgi:Arc/MetJ-type ribon-helix-helix transcriptional regulator